jgi:predicted ATPase
MAKLKQIRVDCYKNLINCVLDLGDFNILVGPNNSGKTNLLESIQIVWAICFGDDRLRERAFRGITPPWRWTSSICHLKDCEEKPLTIGVGFDETVEGKLWAVDYEVKVQRAWSKEQKDMGFVSEVLTAKQPSVTGPAKRYISRLEKEFEVLGKKHPIAKGNSSLLAAGSIYPDFQDLPLELKAFVETIRTIGSAPIFALSPESLRDNMGSEKDMSHLLVSSFDLLSTLEHVQSEGNNFEIFKENLCDILDLDDARFMTKDVPVPDESAQTKKKLKRMRFLFIKRRGGDYYSVDEYSDGTFTVASILAALLSEKTIGPIMYIEELENYLHPAALEKLMRFLQDNAGERPVLITTHSPYLLNCVQNPEDVRVAVVDENGATHFEKVHNTKQLRDYLKSGFMRFGDMLPSNFEDVLGK